MTPYDRMAADLAESKPKIEAALDKLAEAGMPFLDLRQERTVSVTLETLEQWAAALEGAQDITHFGGWRAYMASLKPGQP